MSWFRKFGLPVVALAVSLSGVGCVQPWVATRLDEKLNHKNDGRTPILPPVRDGYPAPLCEDPPSDREVLRSLPKGIRGVPWVYEEFRDDIQITKSRVVDKIDPPRFFPLIGMAQLHHCHWECAVYYTETIESSHPYPFYRRQPKIQVVYIDKDHLHLYVGPNRDAQDKMLLEMTKY